MAISPKFKLKDANSKHPTSIRLIIYHKGERIMYGTGLSVYPSIWDAAREAPKTTSKHLSQLKAKDPIIGQRVQLVSKKLSSIRDEVMRLFMMCEIENTSFTKEKLVSHLDQFLNRSRSDRGIMNLSLNQYLDIFIEDVVDGRILTTSGKRYTEGSIRAIKQFRTVWTDFQKSIRRQLSYENISLNLYNKFVSFMSKRGLSINSIGKHVKHLKAVLNRAYDEGFHENTNHRKRSFVTLKEEVENVYLGAYEVQSIAELDLSTNSSLETYRDVFLIGCYTGLRVSDFNSINSESFRIIDGRSFLQIKTKKTGEQVIIPIQSRLLEILKKYNYSPPRVYPQKLNEALKKIGKLAKIEDPSESKKLVQGKWIFKKVPKYEKIVSHTARRSFATNMYLAGISPIDIMKITGHRTEKAFMKYIKVTKVQTAIRLSNHQYFN